MNHNSLEDYWRGRFCDWMTERTPFRMNTHNLKVAQNKFIEGVVIKLDLRNPLEPHVGFLKSKTAKNGEMTKSS